VKTALLSTIILFIVCSESARSQTNIENRIIWDGELTTTGLARLNKIIDTEPSITGVEFNDSRGAPASAVTIVKGIETQIDKHHLNTFARGQCASACAIAFLLGYERRMLPSKSNFSTHLFLHAARNTAFNEIDYTENDRLLKKIVEQSHGKIKLAFLEKIYEAKNANGGIFILREKTKAADGNSYFVFFCNGEEKQINKPCAPIKDITPTDLGISIAE
jgi:hypothetical protein